jgi:glycerol-3-phosphate acyltransferase PlsX
LNFIGNVEGRDLPAGHADVVVCDGFVGNGLLKIAEGVADLVLTMMKQEVNRSWRTKLGALLLKPSLLNVKRRLDYAEFGGAPLLGVNGVCIIGHGSSHARAIENAIRVATEAIDGHLLEAIQGALSPADPLLK